VQLTSDFSTKYAPGCTAYTIRTDPSTFLLVYQVKCKKKDSKGRMVSNPNGHTVRIKFDPSKIEDSSTVDNLDVKVSCSCPAFLYWGAQWNLGEGDALYNKKNPRPLYQAPTDPQRFQNIICKHIKTVADKLGPLVEKIINRYRDAAAKQKHEEDLRQIETEKIVQQQETDEAEKKEPATQSGPVKEKTKPKKEKPKAPKKEPAPASPAVKRVSPSRPAPKSVGPTPAPEPEEAEVPAEEAPTPTPTPTPEPEPKQPKQEPEAAPEKQTPVKEVIKKKEPEEPNVTTFFDDDDDEIIKINRLLKALPLALRE
jgi:hypothetical protein